MHRSLLPRTTVSPSNSVMNLDIGKVTETGLQMWLKVVPWMKVLWIMPTPPCHLCYIDFICHNGRWYFVRAGLLYFCTGGTHTDFENACKSLCSSPHLCTGVCARVLYAIGSLVLLFSLKFSSSSLKRCQMCCWCVVGMVKEIL